jgi:hypothetical protein
MKAIRENPTPEEANNQTDILLLDLEHIVKIQRLVSLLAILGHALRALLGLDIVSVSEHEIDYDNTDARNGFEA